MRFGEPVPRGPAKRPRVVALKELYFDAREVIEFNA